ncbi:MAG: GGDEF domain-containing protein [Clostridiales bacterium]|nr:GGDEF domain-containing protein [Clostridiales bacterium]
MDLYYCLTFTFSLAATLICLSDFCFVKVQNTMGKTQNKFFVILLWIVALNGICTTLSGFYSIYADKSELALYVIDQARYFYFVIHTALAPVFFFYISHVCGVVFRSNSNKKKYIYYSILIICEALVITNPLTNWVYYRDENNVFTRNWGEAVIYLVSAFFLFLSFKYLYTSWGALNTKRRSGLLMFLGITLTGIVAQLLNPDLKVELFAEAIGLTGVMMIIENEDDRIDIETGLYNRQAFILDLGGYFANKTHLHAISLRINTPEIISRKSGVANRELAEKKVAEYLETIHKKYNIYKLGRRTFVLVAFGLNDDEAYDIASRIHLRFDKPWQLVDTLVLLESSLLVAKIPEQIENLNDALYMFESFQPDDNKKILSGSDLDSILRGSAIEKAISNGLADGKFEVYYQPTYSIDGKTLHGAEALVRLHDDEMGMLYPDEFIPVAENIGLIDAIDDFVLMDVCKMIKDENLDKIVDCINVNLSVIQLMKSGFVEHINGIVEMSGVDKKFINFEVTESISAASYELMNSTINSLKDEGFLFSMDDYGTGYSNMKALASMHLDCIKIDKSILWEAEKSKLGYIILENCVRIIHQMNLDILVEGVETEAQIELLRPLGVKYLQGYYFSKPVPKADFLKIVRESDTQSKA